MNSVDLTITHENDEARIMEEHYGFKYNISIAIVPTEFYGIDDVRLIAVGDVIGGSFFEDTTGDGIIDFPFHIPKPLEFFGDTDPLDIKSIEKVLNYHQKTMEESARIIASCETLDEVKKQIDYDEICVLLKLKE